MGRRERRGKRQTEIEIEKESEKREEETRTEKNAALGVRFILFNPLLIPKACNLVVW